MSETGNSYEELVGELLDAIDSGKLTESTIGQFRCEHLLALCGVTSKLQGGRDMYMQLRGLIQKTAVSRLKKQSVIKVGFMIHDSTVWIGERLYRLFEQSERFEPYVYCLHRTAAQAFDVFSDEYSRLVSFFESRGLRTVVGTGKPCSAEEVPDVCIWLTHWVYDFDDSFRFENFPLSTLHTYISYGVSVADNLDGTFCNYDYNMDLHNIVWKNFARDKINMEDAVNNSFANTNAVYAGYPKMDDFFCLKRNERKDGKKLVIYAPHHTVADSDHLHFATFQYNYRFMLEMAKKYSDRIAWVLKPHPLLKAKAEQVGIFRNAGEWNAYLDEWRSMPDAEVVEEGTYTQLFADSDAMIFDSASFMIEYVFADKPALFLTRSEQRFNRMGTMVKEIHYTADGKDFKAIEDFICNVVLGGNDVKKDERHRFFEENLDYRKNGCLAAENIFNEICRELA